MFYNYIECILTERLSLDLHSDASIFERVTFSEYSQITKKKNANIGWRPEKAYSGFWWHLNVVGTKQKHMRVKQ